MKRRRRSNPSIGRIAIVALAGGIVGSAVAWGAQAYFRAQGTPGIGLAGDMLIGLGVGNVAVGATAYGLTGSAAVAIATPLMATAALVGASYAVTANPDEKLGVPARVAIVGAALSLGSGVGAAIGGAF